MPDVSLLDMLKAGVHFGHQQSRRHPKMEPYIFTTRGGVSIINLEKTQAALTQATTFVRELVGRGGSIMFVGTKKQARDIVRQAAQDANMPYVTDRWIGGLLTNYQHCRSMIQKLHQLKADRASGDLQKYTKKEQLDFEEEITRLETLVGGVSNMERIPEAMFITDVKNEKTALAEAVKIGMPVVAICDTNVNPDKISYCIPANDDATKSLQIICSAMVEAVQKGREEHDRHVAAAAKQAADQAAEALKNVQVA